MDVIWQINECYMDVIWQTFPNQNQTITNPFIILEYIKYKNKQYLPYM